MIPNHLAFVQKLVLLFLSLRNSFQDGHTHKIVSVQSVPIITDVHLSAYHFSTARKGASIKDVQSTQIIPFFILNAMKLFRVKHEDHEGK